MRPKKRFGQNFLQDNFLAEEFATDHLDLSSDSVLEIGGGQGALTIHLAKVCKKLTVLEFDFELLPTLRKIASEANEEHEKKKDNKTVEIIQGDALAFNFNNYDTIVGALPYNISTEVIARFMESKAKRALFIVQWEVGERLVAEAGSNNYSRLSVLVASKARAEIKELVPPESFYPAPQVDSAIVLIEKLPTKEQVELDDSVVSAVFQHKNQTTRNALLHSASKFKLEKAEMKDAVEKLDVELLKKRVRELTIPDLLDLCKQVKGAVK